jgi:hypothetical protein
MEGPLRGEDFLEINQEWPVMAMFANGSKLNEHLL